MTNATFYVRHLLRPFDPPPALDVVRFEQALYRIRSRAMRAVPAGVAFSLAVVLAPGVGIVVGLVLAAWIVA